MSTPVDSGRQTSKTTSTDGVLSSDREVRSPQVLEKKEQKPSLPVLALAYAKVQVLTSLVGPERHSLEKCSMTNSSSEAIYLDSRLHFRVGSRDDGFVDKQSAAETCRFALAYLTRSFGVAEKVSEVIGSFRALLAELREDHRSPMPQD